jgi:hypothetical protein
LRVVSLLKPDESLKQVSLTTKYTLLVQYKAKEPEHLHAS